MLFAGSQSDFAHERAARSQPQSGRAVFEHDQAEALTILRRIIVFSWHGAQEPNSLLSDGTAPWPRRFNLRAAG
jgi:hypothetical protein